MIIIITGQSASMPCNQRAEFISSAGNKVTVRLLGTSAIVNIHYTDIVGVEVDCSQEERFCLKFQVTGYSRTSYQ